MCRGIHRILQQQAPSSDQPLPHTRCDGGILLQASYKQCRGDLIELRWSVLLGFFKSRTNFGGFPKSQFDYKKIRNGEKSRFLYRFLKTNNTPIELLWFRFGVLFIWRRHPDLNWGIRVLQTRALPLGYGAVH